MKNVYIYGTGGELNYGRTYSTARKALEAAIAEAEVGNYQIFDVIYKELKKPKKVRKELPSGGIYEGLETHREASVELNHKTISRFITKLNSGKVLALEGREEGNGVTMRVDLFKSEVR